MPGPAADLAVPVHAPAAASPTLPVPGGKTTNTPERKYKCQYCSRAFSRSEHRSRHERSHTKERPFKCQKCRSTFVRRDLLLRHDRTVHAKDGGVPLHSDGKRRGGPKTKATAAPAVPVAVKPEIGVDDSVLQHMTGTGEDALDVEAAAMLVSDLHHNAQAMMQNNGSFGASHTLSYGQNTNSMIDPPTVTYPNGTIGLPSQWDYGKSNQKNHSITNNGSFASPQSFASTSNTQQSTPHPQYSPSYFARQLSAPESITTQNMANSIQASSSMGTPVSQTNPIHGHQTTAGFNIPQVSSDEDRNMIMDNIRNYDIPIPDTPPVSTSLPNLATINRFLETYFNNFHPHLPFLHPNSFEPTRVSPALLLSTLSIGALYALDQDQAYKLHVGSKRLVNNLLQIKEGFSSRECPLWVMQSSLLNMMLSSWSGSATGVEWSCSMRSLLTNMVAGNIYELKRREGAREGHPPTRAQWLEDEECRRTYYAIYVYCGLQAMSFNYGCDLAFHDLRDLLLPSTETLWNMREDDEAVWQEQLNASTRVTLFDAHFQLSQGEEVRYSAFATRVMINVLFLKIWSYNRGGEHDVVAQHKFRLALETWEKSLGLCEPETATVAAGLSHNGGPLIFNAMAMFRNARVRLEIELEDIQEALRYHNDFEIAGMMTRAGDSIKRSSEMTKVIQECYNCVETAIRQGIVWVARVGPTSWSVEHPLCGMDLMVVLSLWLHRLEHDEEPATEEEMAMYNKVRQLFEADLAPEDVDQLPSVVARLWASTLDEIIVWGINGVFAKCFRHHAQALVNYTDDIDVSSHVSTPSMTSHEDSVF